MLTKLLCIAVKTGEQQEALNANKRASLQEKVTVKMWTSFLEEATLKSNM